MDEHPATIKSTAPAPSIADAAPSREQVERLAPKAILGEGLPLVRPLRWRWALLAYHSAIFLALGWFSLAIEPSGLLAAMLGAAGGALAGGRSLCGSDHWRAFDPAFSAWHLFRPLVGAGVGSLAVFLAGLAGELDDGAFRAAAFVGGIAGKSVLEKALAWFGERTER